MENDERPMSERLRTKKREDKKPKPKRKPPPIKTPMKVEEPVPDSVPLIPVKPRVTEKIQQRTEVLKEQKEALIKRHKKPIKLSYKDNFIKMVEEDLKAVCSDVKENQDQDPKEIKSFILSLRTEIIRGIIKEKWCTREFIKKQWPVEFKAITNKMPFGWMHKNPKIEKMLRNHKPLLPILNTLQKLANDGKNKEETAMLSKGMKFIVNRPKVLDGKMLRNKAGKVLYFRSDWPVSAIQANKAFYHEMADTTGCSINTVRRYIKALVNIGALEVVNVLRHNVQIISYGYYAPFSKGLRHVNYMTQSNFEEVLESGFYVEK